MGPSAQVVGLEKNTTEIQPSYSSSCFQKYALKCPLTVVRVRVRVNK